MKQQPRIACRLRGWLLAAIVLLVATAPAAAQVELSGSWAARNHEDAMERGPGPYAVDYTGVPLNEDARDRALGFSASQLGMIERQCGLYPPHYVALGPFGMKMWNESDPVSGETIAWKVGAWEDRFTTTIWMDGRPHPSSSAPHPPGGFTTGAWEGDTLVAYTTHMRAGVVRRNGVPNSDQTTMTSYFFRNGDLLTLLIVIDDPVYLTEPYMITKNFQLDSSPIRPIGPPCVPGYEGLSGEVPHYLPGTNPSIDELTTLYHIPRTAILGGADTMYPEYRKTMERDYVRPEKCVRNCGAPPRR
jgi:hypothetical protein